MSQDHIILPYSTLKQFSKSGIFWYLDVHTGKICKASARSFNTSHDYYPDWSETYLSQMETLLGRMRDNINWLIEGNKNQARIVRDDVIRCMAMQLLRNPSIAKQSQEKSKLSSFLDMSGCQEQPFWKIYSPLHYSPHYGEECINQVVKTVEKTFADYEINLCTIDNQSSFSFILPTSHCLRGPGKAWLILSPYQAIILLPATENAKNHNEDGSLNYFIIRDYATLEELYKKTVEDEKKNEQGKIVGLRSQLEKLQKYI